MNRLFRPWWVIYLSVAGCAFAFFLFGFLYFNYGFGPLILTHRHTPIDVRLENPGPLLASKKITGVFTANDNYLGLLALRFVSFQKPEYSKEDVLVFRIREKGKKEWYSQNTYRTGILEENLEFPFGFPVIENSKGVQYEFELESRFGSASHAVSIDLSSHFFLSAYQYPKNLIVHSLVSFGHFIKQKINLGSSDFGYVLRLFLYGIPFICWIFIVGTAKKKDELVRRIVKVLVAGIIVDIVCIPYEYEGITLFFYLAWIVTSIMNHFSPVVSIGLAAATTGMYAVSSILHLNSISEKSIVWTYFFFLYGFSQALLSEWSITCTKKYIPKVPAFFRTCIQRYIKSNVLHLVVIGIVLCIVSIVYPVIPLTGDEVSNYLFFSKNGPLQVMTNYELPNNQVFFTLIQSIFIHKTMLAILPYILRIFNVIYAIIFIWMVRVYFRKISDVWWILTALCLAFVFSGPVITPYFIVARGYILGSSLFFGGVYFLIRHKAYLASMLLILSAWTIPTFAYAYPLLFVVGWYALKEKNIWMKTAFLTMAGIALAYFPLLHDIRIQTSRWGYASFWEFVTMTYMTVSNYAYIPCGQLFHFIYIMGYVWSVFSVYKERASHTRTWLLLLAMGILSYFLSTAFFFYVAHVHAPYVRNGFFITLTVVWTMIYVSWRSSNKAIRWLLITLLVGNTIAGLYIFTQTLILKKDRYPVFDGELSYQSIHLNNYLERRTSRLFIDRLDISIIEFYSYIRDIPITGR